MYIIRAIKLALQLESEALCIKNIQVAFGEIYRYSPDPIFADAVSVVAVIRGLPLAEKKVGKLRK